MELCLTLKLKCIIIEYEHVKQKIYTQNHFTVKLANLVHLDICLALS